MSHHFHGRVGLTASADPTKKSENLNEQLPVYSVPATGFARLPALLAVIPVARTTLWRMVRDGAFPRPVRPSPFGSAICVWRWEDVHCWIRGEWNFAENSQREAGGAE